MADGEKLYKTIRQKYTNIINAAVEKCKGFGENAVAGFVPIWYSSKWEPGSLRSRRCRDRMSREG
jgi:hypothetical protein